MQINHIKLTNQGWKVPIDFNGSLPVSIPRAYFTLFPKNSAFLVKSAYVVTNLFSKQTCSVIFQQLKQASQEPTHSNAQAKTQYLMALVKFSIAFPPSPKAQSMHRGAHNVQQHA